MSANLDPTDEKIIALFQANGRLSNRAVGRELGLSESAIRKRLKRLIETEVISYGLVMDEWATGWGVSGWLGVEAKPGLSREVAERLGKMDRCALSFLTSGSFNIRAFVYATDAKELRMVVEEIERFAGVSRVEFREVVEIAQNRNELIMLSHRQTQARWPIDPKL